MPGERVHPVAQLAAHRGRVVIVLQEREVFVQIPTQSPAVIKEGVIGLQGPSTPPLRAPSLSDAPAEGAKPKGKIGGVPWLRYLIDDRAGHSVIFVQK